MELNEPNPLDDVRNTLTHARLCYEAWWIIVSDRPQRDQIVWTFDRYVEFFNTVLPALWVSFVVKLSSVFGTRNDEITLKAIPGIEQQPAFANIWARGRCLHKYRSKVIAHRDTHVQTTNYAELSGFTYDGLRTLLEDTCNLFDAAAKCLRIECLHPLTCEVDTLRLIGDLQHFKKPRPT